MNKICNIAILILALVICVSFFLPWVSIESRVAGSISKIVSGTKQASLKKISGYQVPILANGPDAKLMISIIQLFNPTVTDADKKSWLIWGIPGLAVVFAGVALYLSNNKWVNLGMGILGALVFIIAAYKLKTTDMDKFVLNVATQPGLWLILWSYFGIGLVSLFRFSKLQFVKDK